MKLKIISFMLLLSLFLAGCSASDNQNAENNTTQSETTPVQETAVTENTQETGNIENAKEEKRMPVFPEFKGINISEEGLKYSNLNNKPDSRQIFCYNGDTIYFSNPTDEYKLYSLVGENTTRLTDIKAFSLNYFNGSIYFLSSKNFYIDSLTGYGGSGRLYKYDLESGETVQLSDITMSNLVVGEKGIFYTENPEEGIVHIYKFDLESGKSELAYDSLSAQIIDDYSITRENIEDGYWDYYLEGNGEKIPIVSNVSAYFDCIHKGVYYFRDYRTMNLYSINLQTGENKQLRRGGKGNYTVFQNEIYTPSNDCIYRIEDCEPVLIEVENNKYILYSELENHCTYVVKYLFSNDKSLYALVKSKNITTNEEKYEFAKLEFTNYGVKVKLDVPEEMVYVRPIV